MGLTVICDAVNLLGAGRLIAMIFFDVVRGLHGGGAGLFSI